MDIPWSGGHCSASYTPYPLEGDVDRVDSGCLLYLPGRLNGHGDEGQTIYIKIEL